ncbi:hypothetical protein RRG08_026940 [Elysia crispata]|uniref:Uncharacterized protein n=1 Tax=Elysia crispata TaxID=231223 RepID=A0AAE0YQC0_9GAST|nr:hypothetical protein RRG08_026940 [Elysia crispata]
MRSTHRFKSGGGYTPAWYDARAARGGSSSLANTVKLIHARESAHKSESARKSESMSARKNEDESAHEIEESNAAFKFDSEAKYHPGPQHAAASDEVLQYARSEVNFTFGEDLYMAPGDMRLRVGLSFTILRVFESYSSSPMDSFMALTPPYLEANVLRARNPPTFLFIIEITFPFSGVQ